MTFTRDNLTKFLCYFSQDKAFSSPIRDNDNIMALWGVALIQSKEFPDESFDLVPFYRISDLFVYGYP